MLDTSENKPVIINVPDGPTVIAHHLNLVEQKFLIERDSTLNKIL